MRKIGLLLCFLCLGPSIVQNLLYAQENKEIVALSKQLMEAKDCPQVFLALEKLKTIYFTEHKYNEFADFIKSYISHAKIPCAAPDYFLAASRINQLKYLEESQNWNEYFSEGLTLRQESQNSANKAIQESSPGDPVNLYAKSILWRFNKDQQNSEAEALLSDLVASAQAYSQVAAADSLPLKEVADQLASCGEKQPAKKVYGFYVQKLLSSKVTDEDLIASAENFYKEGNLDLAESIYDAYLERMSKSKKQKKLLSDLIGIARQFSFKDQGQRDPAYAERIFQEIDKKFGKEAFDEELMYLRAFNLEKMHNFKEAKDIYVELAARFPKNKYIDKVNFKSGIIYIYVLRDASSGKPYLEALAKKEGVSPYTVSSLYQLGLLSQWEGNLGHAEDYYDRLIELTSEKKDNFGSAVFATQERLKEIGASSPIEYNLKTFLDTCLKNEYASLNAEKALLSCSPYTAAPSDSISVTLASQAAGGGCMQIELQYLWSGELGSAQPSIKDPAFNTKYSSGGTKIIGVVVVAPPEIFDRAIDFVDID